MGADDIHYQQRVIALLVERVVVYPDKRMTIHLSIELRTKAESERLSINTTKHYH